MEPDWTGQRQCILDVLVIFYAIHLCSVRSMMMLYLLPHTLHQQWFVGLQTNYRQDRRTNDSLCRPRTACWPTLRGPLISH